MSRYVEEHLEGHPLPVDRDRAEQVALRVQQRIEAASRPEPGWSRWWLASIPMAAAAAALLLLGRPEPTVEPVKTAEDVPPAAAADVSPVRITTAGAHELAAGTVALDPGAEVLSMDAVLFVARGSVRLDGQRLAPSTWVLPQARFTDGEPGPVDLPAPIDVALRSLRALHLLDHLNQENDMTLFLSALLAVPQALALDPDTRAAAVEACVDCDEVARSEVTGAALMARYVDDGTVDTALARSFRALQPEVYEGLPDAFQRVTAAEPAGDPAGPPALTPLRWIEPPRDPAASSPGRTRATLELTVVDPAGAPVTNAIVQALDEQDRHLVNSENGMWHTSVLYLPDGNERLFDKDERFDIEVMAPGYTLERIQITGKRRGKIRQTVTLRPAPIDPATPEAAAALRAQEAWLAVAERPENRGGTPPEAAAVAEARQRAVLAARAWMAAGGGQPAEKACLVAGRYDTCGLTPAPPPTQIHGEGLTEESVRAVLDTIEAGDCTPKKGWVQVSFYLMPDGGEPRSIEVRRSSLGHVRGDQCVAERVSGVSFEATGKAQIVWAPVFVK